MTVHFLTFLQRPHTPKNLLIQSLQNMPYFWMGDTGRVLYGKNENEKAQWQVLQR